MTNEELLLQLRDIQAPAEPAWWLIASGYLWLAALLASLVAGVWLLRRQRRNERLARLAQRELQMIHADYQHNLDTRLLAWRVSRWLKQVALLAFPARQLQSTNGEVWLEFLDQSLADRPFTEGCGRVFAAAVYRREVTLDAEQVIALCERWLQVVKPGLQRRGRAW